MFVSKLKSPTCLIHHKFEDFKDCKRYHKLGVVSHIHSTEMLGTLIILLADYDSYPGTNNKDDETCSKTVGGCVLHPFLHIITTNKF